jgi:hypothetical protein
MVEIPEKNRSAYAEAERLLAAAVEQLNQINKALAANPNAQLESASGRARGAVSQIADAMRAGNLDAASLASLSAALNIGVDASAVAIEAAQGSRAVAARVQLAAASVESHTTVQRMTVDLFGRHEFDADVARHTHGAELETFKRREAEDKEYIREQLAHGTPEGDLNASGRMQGYMLDANAHGAGDNPDFLKKWNELKEKTDRLRQSIRAAGKSTEEYDKYIREEVVSFLKGKGLSDQQINEALAKNENPLDAVKPYLGGDDESRDLANRIRHSGDSAATVKSAESRVHVPPEQPLTINMDALDARLAAAGLDLPGDTEPSGHGLTIQKAGRASGAIVR